MQKTSSANFEVKATEYFAKRLKRLSKKYQSLLDEVAIIIDSLSVTPNMGTPIGRNCYKIRVSISSKGKGKSGGPRLITYALVTEHTVFLVDIYDKSEQVNISSLELQALIKKLIS